MNHLKLTRLSISGFKSIGTDERAQSMELGDINVVIGANGAGKSNVVSFFKMLNMMMTGALQQYIGAQGSSYSLLNYGPQVTPTMEGHLYFQKDDDVDSYHFSLSHGSGDILFFEEESIEWHQINYPAPLSISLGSGHKETNLIQETMKDNTSKIIYQLLRSYQVFHFHDTSSTARIRNKGYIEHIDYLRSDGGNLAAYLSMMQTSYPQYYARIVRRIQEVFPPFHNFSLKTDGMNSNYISLNWKELGCDDYFLGPHQLSDGTLRFIALATLLLQPPERMPSGIILDEPELGLHPSAISSFADMVVQASQYCQIIIATQSPRLVDEFSPSDIIVAERDENTHCSRFHRLNEESLGEWLERFSLSELWEKNVLGGQP